MANTKKVAIKNGQAYLVCSQQYDEWQDGSGRVYTSSEDNNKVRVKVGRWGTQWLNKNEIEIKVLPDYEASCLIRGQEYADSQLAEAQKAAEWWEQNWPYAKA
jgi:hypothetical protein